MSAPPRPPWLAPPKERDEKPALHRLRLPQGLSYRGRAVLAWCLVLMDREGELSRVHLVEAMGVSDRALQRSLSDLEVAGIAHRVQGPEWRAEQRIRVVIGRVFTEPASCETCSGPLGVGAMGARSCQTCVAAVLRADRSWRTKAFDAYVTARATGASESAAVYRAHKVSGAPLYSESGDREAERGVKLSERRAVVPMLLSMKLLSDTETWWRQMVEYRSGGEP